MGPPLASNWDNAAGPSPIADPDKNPTIETVLTMTAQVTSVLSAPYRPMPGAQSQGKVADAQQAARQTQAAQQPPINAAGAVAKVRLAGALLARSSQPS